MRKKAQSRPAKNKKGNICSVCQVNTVASKGNGKYRCICESCHSRPYTRERKNYCENCGFIAIHRAQLDVDHIDGNRENNSPENLRTLCANCHRLKHLCLPAQKI